VQLGFGDPVPDPASGIREVFGVSATAALFRRQALSGTASGDEIFDPRLFLYYEDVDLACRLRAAGWRALLVPAARAGHAGSASGRTIGRDRWRFLYGNRYLVVARLLGRSFWPRLPWMALRDLADLVRAFPRRERIAGILAGWGRAVRLLPSFARRGTPAVPLGEIRRFR
jgi:GT2 family glycosyltransferase